MKLLLHICCAPCALAPFLELVNKKIEISGFFYNPNIHPSDEYEKRMEAVKIFSAKENLEVIIPNYEAKVFYNRIGYAPKTQKERCPFCWQLRLEKTASFARENNFKAFTTTLLISPYQDHERIKQIGLDLSNKYGIDFYYQDLRPFFRDSQNKARQQELYRQKYCGCLFSRMEREEEKALLLNRKK